MEKMFETQQEFLGSDKNGKIIVNKLFNFYKRYEKILQNKEILTKMVQ